METTRKNLYTEPYVDETGEIVLKFDKKIARTIANQLVRTPDFVKKHKVLFKLSKDLQKLADQVYGD